jgi:hypothetical protein
VGPAEVQFRYVATSPCRDTPGRAVTLARHRTDPVQ